LHGGLTSRLGGRPDDEAFVGIVDRDGVPSGAPSIDLGGLVFAVLTAIWLASALWFFRTNGVTA
jgi:hypothetical protein